MEFTLVLRRNKLVLRFLYKLKSNTLYIETLNTLDDREDQNYKDNERSIKPTGLYPRRQKQRYTEEMNQAQQPPWLAKNIIFCYDAEKHTKNDSKRKKHFLQHKGNHSNFKKANTYRSKSTGKKVGFAAVFADFAKGSIHPHS